jgi:arylsulfatase A-like enzyme
VGERARPDRAWALILLLAAMAVCGCGAKPRHPDVLLITIDTLRADHLHAYGFPLEDSPNLDALAAQGVLFERAIAASASTAPSHASIMTARYPREHTVGHGNGSTRLERDPTLAELFSAAGYRTAAFVGNLVLERRTGFDRGFDHFDDELDRREVNRAVWERIAEHTTARALAWLDQARDDPWFLWVHYQDPHGPYTPPKQYLGRFHVAPASDEQPLPMAEGNAVKGGIPKYQQLDGLTRPSQYESRYVDEIFYADVWIGRLLEAVGPDAIVLVTADHGEAMGEHGRWFVHQWTTTPENAHVPMILRAPGIDPGRRSRLVSHVDVAPTLAELAGLPPPPEARGIALGPFLRDGRPLPDRVVLSDAGHEVTAYRNRWFVRIPGTPPAERTGEPDAPPVPDHGIGYAWRNNLAWSPMKDDVALSNEVRDYLSRTNTPAPAPLIDLETRERLRALGYEAE